ncbi:hypothetical protein WJX72_000544 [[Myrmecia] bisecta]|uniref:Dynein attachment factor N-terminal domain-containing protein n=1 Tax=[Myrmecia] bisecta TaxID=41462 RepID=A0AAW1QNZ8_9CHLO
MALQAAGAHPLKKTSKELATALQDDFRRQATDLAKKRAVAQHVDYDTFKNMVAVAHLRPLQAPQLQPTGPTRCPGWEFAADGTLALAADTGAAKLSQGKVPEDGTALDAIFVADVLEAMQGAGRFSLAVHSLGRAPKVALAALLARLHACDPALLGPSRLRLLIAAYS